MKTLSFLVAFAAVAFLFGAVVGPAQAAVAKSSSQTMHHPRYATSQHTITRHHRTAANQCLAKPGSMRALFCPTGAPAASAKK
jgi:hypothetical protein